MAWVLLENVTGLLMWHQSGDAAQPPAIAYVVSELESLGYRWAQRVVSLTAFGLPQRRRRVFIVASLHGDPRDVLLSSESVCHGQCIDMPADLEDTSVKECYECFNTPPHVQTTRTVACVDFSEKRNTPLFHELSTLTTSNGKQMCLVEHVAGKTTRAYRLSIEVAERACGLPIGWTEPCYPLYTPGRVCPRLSDADVATSKRFEMVGITVGVPQAQWIGSRLTHPYAHKFLQIDRGVPFLTPIPGGIPDERSGSEINAWPKVAWNMLDGQKSDSSSQPDSHWRSRHSLSDVSETPVICRFKPLGNFIGNATELSIDFDQAARYLERIRAEGMTLDPFIENALQSSKRPVTQSTRPDQVVSQTRPGEIVWSPFKCAVASGKKVTAYWPALALHLDRDRDHIPEDAFKIFKKTYTADTHRLVAYYGEHRYEWVKADSLLDFSAHYEKFEKQSCLSLKAKYGCALTEATEEETARTTSKKLEMAKKTTVLETIEVAELKRRIGSLDDLTHVTCGACRVCVSRRLERQPIPFSERHLQRNGVKPNFHPPLPGVRPGDRCPQIEVHAFHLMPLIFLLTSFSSTDHKSSEGWSHRRSTKSSPR